MRSVEQIRDFDHLKQAALLLEKENERLHVRLKKQATELASLQGKTPSEVLLLELKRLNAERGQAKNSKPWNRSERRPRPKPPRTPTEAQTGHGPRAQPSLPIREEKHVLAGDARTCSACAGQVEEWPNQFEESEEITVVKRRFELVVHRRQKYRCKCNGNVVTAPGPAKLIPGGRYSLEFAVEVACDKYLDHLPLERQAGRMQRQGLVVTSQTLWDQVHALATLLEPNLQSLKKELLGSPLLHVDETWWRLMNGKSPKNWWSWCIRSGNRMAYEILPTRGNDSGATVLTDYSGIVMADAYVVYKSLQKASAAGSGAGFTLAHCWSHARRKYCDIEAHYPKACGEVLDLIGRLYLIERDAKQAASTEGELLVARTRLRAEKSRPLIDTIRDWAYAQRCTPESSLHKAVKYMLRHWETLTRFLANPRIPLDNNPAEQALRGTVLGRRNHYGSRSERGTRAAALFYSLLETARASRHDPRRYLLDAARQQLHGGPVLLPS